MRADGEALSIVVPFYNEETNVAFVLNEVHDQLPAAEIIAVDDGSSDGTWREITRLPFVRGLRLKQNRGQSSAMYLGLRACTRPLCGLMDGDGQNDPASFHAMLAALDQTGADVICGYRQKRRDTWSRRAASRFANAVRRGFLKDGVRDTGCSQKIFPRRAVELLFPFRGMHRYLPAIFVRARLKIAEVPVGHRPRREGVSKYNNLSRALDGLYDLIGVQWLLNRKPLPVELEQYP